MEFKTLFERLRKQGLNCRVAEMRLIKIKSGIDTKHNSEFLTGYLWGLDTANLITDDERDELISIIINLFLGTNQGIDEQKGESL